MSTTPNLSDAYWPPNPDPQMVGQTAIKALGRKAAEASGLLHLKKDSGVHLVSFNKKGDTIKPNPAQPNAFIVRGDGSVLLELWGQGRGKEFGAGWTREPSNRSLPDAAAVTALYWYAEDSTPMRTLLACPFGKGTAHAKRIKEAGEGTPLGEAGTPLPTMEQRLAQLDAEQRSPDVQKTLIRTLDIDRVLGLIFDPPNYWTAHREGVGLD